MKYIEANSATEVPRASGVIWVASVCSVLCSMKKPSPMPSTASGAKCQTGSTASVRNDSPISTPPALAMPVWPSRRISGRTVAA